jgi:hypothetical protein
MAWRCGCPGCVIPRRLVPSLGRRLRDGASPGVACTQLGRTHHSISRAVFEVVAGGVRTARGGDDDDAGEDGVRPGARALHGE